MPWRTIKDKFGKFKWTDHEGRVYQGTPFAFEPDATVKTVFIAIVMHAQMQHQVLSEKPDVTCPSDVQDSECRKEVLHHEDTPGHSTSKKRSSLTRSPTSQSRLRAFLSHPMHCDMFQYLRRPSTNCGYWEMPPLLQQGRRVNKD